MIGRASVFAAALVLAAPGAASAQVSVSFVAPESYTDAGNRVGSNLTQRAVLGEIHRLITGLGARVLAPGESLSVTVLDIDLAGIDYPGAALPYGPRVVTDVTPPRFRLRYALRSRGRVVSSGEETVTDINFQMRYARAASFGTFGYERELLRDWMQRRFGQRGSPNG